MAFTRIGIVAGVQEEADAFAPGAHEAIETHGAFSFRRVKLGGAAAWVTCSGVGKVNAAMAATLLASLYRVDLLMIIGTAGRLRPLAGACFVIHEAVQGDYGAQRSDGFTHYTAGSWPIGPARVEAFLAQPLGDLGLPQARIVTGDCFVECADHSYRLRENLAGDLVDMETGALAQAALRLGVPWAAIKAATDFADGDSAAAFQANLLHAARLAAEAAERAIMLVQKD